MKRMDRCGHGRITPAKRHPYSASARYTCDDCEALLQYPFLEEGKTVSGRHYRRGPEVEWVEIPDPTRKFLKEQTS
jgi:hypothetical protein